MDCYRLKGLKERPNIGKQLCGVYDCVNLFCKFSAKIYERCVRVSRGREEQARPKWSKSSTHLFRRESPAPEIVVISVVQSTGIRFGCFSRASRKEANREACSEESAGTANAAERACNGSKDALLAAIYTTDVLFSRDLGYDTNKPK